jgi:hypothetical protein
MNVDTVGRQEGDGGRQPLVSVQELGQRMSHEDQQDPERRSEAAECDDAVEGPAAALVVGTRPGQVVRQRCKHAAEQQRRDDALEEEERLIAPELRDGQEPRENDGSSDPRTLGQQGTDRKDRGVTG